MHIYLFKFIFCARVYDASGTQIGPQSSNYLAAVIDRYCP